MIRVLFVCLGNICRSPAGQAILARQAEERGIPLHVESCALGDWHVGSLPDARMRRAAQNRGLILNSIAQVLRGEHFTDFDYILAADRSILTEVKQQAAAQKTQAIIQLITHWSDRYRDQEVPDPYTGSMEDFEHVLDMLEESCSAFLSSL